MSLATRTFTQYAERSRAPHADTRYARAVIEVGRKIQMVVDHPGWQEYVNHLEAMRDAAQRKRDSVVSEIVNTDKLGEELAKLKLQLTSLEGELKGLSAAIDLVPELIKRAADAVKVMDSANSPRE